MLFIQIIADDRESQSPVIERDLAESGMRCDTLQVAFISLTLFLGIPLLRSADAEERAMLILYAIRQFDHITRHSRTGYSKTSAAKPNCENCNRSLK
ncbi:MAG: hypothetical protein ACXW0T_13705 [Methylobacter sp.]